MFLTRCTTAAVLLATLLACSQRQEDRVGQVGRTPTVFPVWEKVNVDTLKGADLIDLWVRPDGKEAWAVGSRNTILHYADSTWHADRIDSEFETTWKSVAFDETGRVGFVVGSNGRMARYAGADQWVKLPPMGQDSLTSAWLDPGGLHGFVVGLGGVALKYENGRWGHVLLESPPAGGHFEDVVANDHQLWVRDSTQIAVYSLPDLKLLRRFDDFRAFTLWKQPNSPSVWMVAVQYQVKRGQLDSPTEGSGYTIRAYDNDERASTVHRISHALLTMSMGTDSCGIGAGGLPAGPAAKDVWPLLLYLSPARTTFTETPGSVSINRLWSDSACASGWGVGNGGFLGRWRLGSWKVGPLAWPDGNIATLKGHFNLKIDSVQARVTLDSMRLVGRSPLKLDSAADFTASNVSNGIEFALTDNGREHAQLFKDSELRLRLYLTFRTDADTVRVAYEKVEPFRFEPVPRWEKTRSIVSLVIAALAVALAVIISKRHRILRYLSSLIPPDALGGLPFRFVRIFVRENKAAHRSLFTTYLDNLRREYRDDPAYVPPLLGLKGCEWLAPANLAVASRETLVYVHKELTKQHLPVLWIEDPDGGSGRALLRCWVGIALEQNGIPVLVELTRPGQNIEQKAVQQWITVGDLEPKEAEEIEIRNFVFLLDGSKGIDNQDDAAQFVENHRWRNQIVLCSRNPPTVEGVCHLRVQNAAGTNTGSSAQP